MASLEQLKNEVIEILKRKEKQENKDIQKAIESFEKEEKNHSYLEKSITGEWIEKAGYAVGQMRIWRGKKYKKVSTSPSRWVRVYDSHSRGAAISIGKYIAQVNKCKSVEELYQFCMKEKALFKDANGVDLPILDKLKKEIDKKNESLSSQAPSFKETTNAEKKEETKPNKKKGALKVLSKEETKEFIKKHKNSKENERVSLGTISEDAKKRIKEATSLDVERVILDSDSVRHAFDPKHNLEENDLDDMKDVVETSTDISLSPNKNKTGNPIIIFKKQEPNGVILLEEYRAGKKELELQTAYRVKKNRQPLSVDKQPLANVQNVAAPNKTITDNDENVKQEKRELLKTEISDYYKEQLSYSKWIAERSVKKLGEKKLKEIADKNMKSDEDWKNELLEKVSEMIKENPQDEEKIKDSMKTAIYFHAVRVLEVDLARKKLDSMSKNIEMKDVPVKDSDMTEAKSIIGGDVARILDGRDVYGNAKQTLQDKIKRRFKTNPAVCRAMLVYIKQEQEKTGKQVFTARNGIWELLPKLNEKAQEAAEKGESETPTGTSGNLYENNNGVSIVENKDWGRYQISFPGKPDGSTISMLKRNGFRWSPSTKTWVCYNGENGERKMKYVAEQLGLNEVKKSFDFSKYLKKSMSFDELKKWAINHLKKQLQDEDVAKSLYLTTLEVIQKAAYPVGTIREWKGKKYIKTAPGKWMRKYDNAGGRGYNQAIKNLMRKVEAAETPEQLYSLIKQNLRRFKDEKTGKILPEVKEIYAMAKNEKSSTGKLTETINSIGKKKEEVKKEEKKEDENVEKFPGETLESKKKQLEKLKSRLSKLESKGIELTFRNRGNWGDGMRLSKLPSNKAWEDNKDKIAGVKAKIDILKKEIYDEEHKPYWIQDIKGNRITNEDAKEKIKVNLKKIDELSKGDEARKDIKIRDMKNENDYLMERLNQNDKRDMEIEAKFYESEENSEAEKQQNNFSLDDIKSKKTIKTVEEFEDVIRQLAAEKNQDNAESKFIDFLGYNLEGGMAGSLYDKIFEKYGDTSYSTLKKQVKGQKISEREKNIGYADEYANEQEDREYIKQEKANQTKEHKKENASKGVKKSFSEEIQDILKSLKK